MNGDEISRPTYSATSPPSSAKIPAFAVTPRRFAGSATPTATATSELEVDKGICLIGSQKRDHDRARKSKRHPRTDRGRCKTIFVSRRFQIQIKQQQRQREQRQEEEGRGKLRPPTPLCEAFDHGPCGRQRLRPEEDPC